MASQTWCHFDWSY